MSSAGAHSDISRTIGRARAYRARVQRRRRRMMALAVGAFLATGLGTAFSLASFAGGDLADAAVTRAKSLMDLMSQRSPGERTAAELIKTKHKRLAEKEAPEAAPKPEVPKNLAEVIAPPAVLVPVELAEAVPELSLSPPPGEILLPPPGGVVPPSCCGGKQPPPGGPPSGPPVPPPALPEPGTWMTMILGFGLTGWSLRRSKVAIRSHARA